MPPEKKHASPETILARFGRPWVEIARLTDQHTRAVQGWLSSRAPQAQRYHGLGVRASSTGLPVPLLNLALGGDFPASADEPAIAAEIEAVKAFFTRRGVPWYWWLGPHRQPADMGQRLEQHGIQFDPPPLPAMAVPLPVTSLPPYSAEIQVWPAADRADLIAASAIRRLAFRFPEGAALTYFEDMAADWLDPAGPARLYLARLGDGPPAAIGALIMGADLPGVYIMATLPGWGRRGLGKAILARILSQAAADGHSLIILTAGDQGYPLYRQFGFEHIFDYDIFSTNPVPDLTHHPATALD